MTISMITRRVLATVMGIVLGSSMALAQDEPQVFNAFAIATASGTVVRASAKQVMLAGTVKGPMFIETDEGPVPAGTVACAASLRVDQESRRQTANGACTFTAEDGAQAWGDWECTGFALVGCRGALTLNGGSGRLQGVSGGGSMIWRPNTHDLETQGDGTVLQNTSGIVIWREFKLTKK
ncbi:hypothetical protein SAMN02745126_06060 [Enhydrobacter aerosaccus]|uniref:Uncharacterized protein n=1 Tax=Enhydrobacter aerosaccus TaxID=225324 RepID=A0A1T4TDV6_9HYPH|nr:hypothetical protein [Enhydrobacter aerosaccus]SKA38596.1 hypothetical protein SAMN02745126_06060 [Enhydrobacter aerosaccus]